VKTIPRANRHRANTAKEELAELCVGREDGAPGSLRTFKLWPSLQSEAVTDS
jgi:hypothetical protein